MLSLKVMRLSRATFAVSHPQLRDDGLGCEGLDSLNIGRHSELGISSMLTLPPGFGNIHLGECFSAYLSVNNDGNVSVHDVAFKAELQTTSQRFTLAGAGTPTGSASNIAEASDISIGSHATLIPSQSAEFKITHDIKELGIHILVCSVHYTPVVPNSSMPPERKFFRKFYKFMVLNPISIKTKINTLDNQRVAVETQVINLANIIAC